MALVPLIEYEAAAPAVRAVYDDIRATRKTDYINNFWKVLAHDPAMLARTWANVKEVMAAGCARSAGQGDDLHRRQRDQQLRVLHSFAHGRRARRRE